MNFVVYKHLLILILILIVQTKEAAKKVKRTSMEGKQAVLHSELKSMVNISSIITLYYLV